MAKGYGEIRNLLATQQHAGLCGEGASEEEILACEAGLSLRFPPSYRSFLNEFGWGYFGSLELIAGLGSDIPEEWGKGANLFQVVSDERKGPLNFPPGIVPFCQNGAGDWYALDCRRDNDIESPVVFVSHEQAVSRGFSAAQCADSFADWIFARLTEDAEGSQAL